MRRARGIFEFGQKQVMAGGEKRRYMDIGCNKGFLLAMAHEHGWDVYGIELVRELIRPFINSYPQYKNQIFSKRFEDAKEKVEGETFDLITAIDVIEHFEDVSGDLRGIYELLKPGGVFLIQTPDSGGERALQQQCTWKSLKPLEHLHLFNEESLRILSERIGFDDIEYFSPFDEANGNFVAVLRK
ncbi:class I SAM-dependent methyltransferase [Thiohalophilus sp.]|uniref:class I SAM-dependent methyltransferase n=1 Tax=Thiohalophilus sp. TaxID=3028392 RepID=UPI002ACD50EB|nr:class I SAM-dependent methyltransferase [Thiohalophilus sp.]MDZ7804192.1 class I SAM-dependent methyltransferase [Thiohalophilus sp.]